MLLQLSLYVPDSVTVVQFADDTQLLISGRKRDLQRLVTIMEEALSNVFQWFCSNGMKVNAAKTQMLVLGTPAMLRDMPSVSINFCGAVVPDSKTVKNLGVTMDSQLTYQAHVDGMTRKCAGILISLNHARHAIPHTAIQTIVQGLVISILRYGMSVYGTCGQVQMNRVQKLVNFCARVVSGRRRYDHISDVMKNLQWMSANDLTQYHRLCMLHSVLTAKLPRALYETIVRQASSATSMTPGEQVRSPYHRSETRQVARG